MTRVGIAALAGLLGACATEPPPAPLPSIESVPLEGIEEGPVHGTVDGEPFRAADSRFVVVTREGRERVDLVFSDRPVERCGLPIEREDVRVWVRFAGRGRLDPGTFALDGTEDDAELEVHYEHPDGPAIVGVHRGVARVEISEASRARVEGALHVCFADSSESCVEGTFEATPCLSRIDGRALREPPGLSDEALDAVGAREQ